jgi:hypothetical protein
MGSPPSAIPEPSNATDATDANASSPAPLPHDFEAQKRIHQQIRNDPDYDDWEYGTEPLPHEAWIARQAASSQPAGEAPSPED